MFLETLDSSARLLFRQLGNEPLVSSFFLAGGSALALHLGHRVSVDLDFFSLRSYSMPELMNQLQRLGHLTIENQTPDTLVGELNNVKLSFFTYPYPLLDAMVLSEGIQVASLLDIALMKIAAIGQRGTKRDFIDVYCLCQQGFSLKSLLQRMPHKFPTITYPSYHLLRALAYFDDAEHDEPPRMLKPVEWKTARNFFADEVDRLLRVL
jgi:predicted nucleotidyltransferase component of viral defense system